MKFGPVRNLPREVADCGWYNILPPPGPARPLNGRESANWAIIGAGVCGLAVARRLAEHRPDDRIVLLEATRVGLGASGRNSGFVLNYSPHGVGSGADHDFERRYALILSAGVDELRRLVAEHQIRCDWSEWGRLYVSAGEDGDAQLAEIRAAHRRIGAETEDHDADSLRRLTGSDFYTSGLWAAGNALVQPAAMVRGLAATLPLNVELREATMVVAIHRQGGGFRLDCNCGEVRADRLILTGGCHTARLGGFRHRLLTIATYASMTRRLSEEERRRHFPATDELGLLPASHNGSTVRLTRDGRLLIRNSFQYSPTRALDPAVPAAARDNHRRALRARWPALGDVEFEHAWGGGITYTRNQGALFGRLADGVHGVVAGDAGPVARGSITGRLLADHIVGADSELLAAQLSLSAAAWLPPDPILGFAVNRRLKAIRRDGAPEL